MAGVGANGVLSEGVRTGFLANTEAEMRICLVSKMRRHKSASSSIVGVDKTTKRQKNEQSGGCICRRRHPGFVVRSASSAVSPSSIPAIGETRLVLASKTADRGPGRTACIYSESVQAVLGLGFGLVEGAREQVRDEIGCEPEREYNFNISQTP